MWCAMVTKGRSHPANEWPGTRLIGHLATVSFFRVRAESIRVLSSVSRLYAWLAPDHPEDLAFYRSDGSCCFASISHEKDSRFNGPFIMDEIKAKVPGPKVRKHKD